MNWQERQCDFSPKGLRKLSHTEAKQCVVQLAGWKVEGEDSLRIFKDFCFSNYRQTVAFVNRVASLAEAENHHPEIRFDWNRVTVTFFTHKASGLTVNDFVLAAKVDAL